MSGMDQMLAGFFGTGVDTQPTAEDAEKTAAAEMFAKIAASEGIDLATLPPAKIEWLWERTMGKEASAAGEQAKQAEFPPKKDGDEDGDKKKQEAEARKEHEEKKAAAESFNQATYFGKTAAHAYVAEMKEIIGAGGLDFMKEAGFKDKAKEMAGKAVSAVGNATGASQLSEAARLHKKLGPGGRGVAESTRHLYEEGRNSNLRQGATRAAATAAATGAAGAGIHHATKEKKSSVSSFEMEAAELALAKIAEANFDQEEAVNRLNAVLTLGMGESEKVASLDTFEDAIERRALEYAQAAGYPVEWAQ